MIDWLIDWLIDYEMQIKFPRKCVSGGVSSDSYAFYNTAIKRILLNSRYDVTDWIKICPVMPAISAKLQGLR